MDGWERNGWKEGPIACGLTGEEMVEGDGILPKRSNRQLNGETNRTSHEGAI